MRNSVGAYFPNGARQCIFSFAMSANSHLRNLLRERSVRTGDFTLASGRSSRYYIDARLTTMTGEGPDPRR